MKRKIISILSVVTIILTLLPTTFAKSPAYNYVQTNGDSITNYSGTTAKKYYDAMPIALKQYAATTTETLPYDILNLTAKNLSEETVYENIYALSEFALYQVLLGNYNFSCKYNFDFAQSDATLLYKLVYTYFPHWASLKAGWGDGSCKLIFDYNYITEERAFAQNYIGKEFTKTATGKTESEQIQIIHDYVIGKTTYGDNKTSHKGNHGQMAYCALSEGEAVCAGYANAFALLGFYAGIDAPGYCGTVDKQDHRWNMVYSKDKVMRVVDTTWDDNGTTQKADQTFCFKTPEELANKFDNRRWDNRIDTFVQYLHTGTVIEISAWQGSGIAEKSPIILKTTSEVVPSAQINLSAETIFIPSGYNTEAYSINNGKTWTKGTFDNKTLARILTKDSTLVLANLYDLKERKPAKTAILLNFPTILARPKFTKPIINYAINADATGETTGRWVLSDKEKLSTPLTNIEIAAYAADKKTLANYGDLKTTGIAVEIGKAKKNYSIRLAPELKGTNYVAASKAVKITPANAQKAPKLRVDYKKEILKIRQDFAIYGGTSKSMNVVPAPLGTLEDKLAEGYLEDEKAYVSVARTTDIDMSDYIGDAEKTVVIWKIATAKKPASEKQVYVIAARAPQTGFSVTVINGRAKLPPSIQIYNSEKETWGTMPKLETSTKLYARIKPNVRANGVKDTGFAASEDVTLNVEYGVTDAVKGKSGILSATFLDLPQETETPVAVG